MRFLPVLLFSTLISAQVTELIGAINKTLADGIDLFGKVTAFDGNPTTGLLDAVKIQAAAYNVQQDILAASTIAQATTNFTDAESLEVATAVLGLVPPIKLLLTTIVDKKPAFQKIVLGLFDLTPEVLKVLTKTKSLAVSLGTNVVAKLSGGIKEAAPALLQDISNAFDTAIAAYSVD